MNKIATLAATAAVAAGGIWYLSGPGDNPAMTPFTPAQAQEGEATAEASDVEIQEMTLGNEDAAVQVIEYASFTCPHCRDFHDNVFPQLKADYIDTGEIEFVYRDVYFDR